MIKSPFLKRIPAALSSIFIAGLILRAWRIGSHDLWYDEIITIIRICKLNILKIPDPPLYYILLSGWTGIFGFSETSLRFPSLLFSAACIIPAFLLGKKLFGRSCGLYAAFFTAFSPFQLWYAQEARCYSLLAFCALASAYFQYLSMTRREKEEAGCREPRTAASPVPDRAVLLYRKHKYLIWSLICSAAGLYTHPYYIFFITAQFLCFFPYSMKGRLPGSIRWWLLIPLVFLPLLARSWIRLGHTLNAYWIPAPDWRSFLISLENFGLGYNSSLPAYWIFDAACLVISAYVMRRAAKAGEERKKLLFSSLLFSVPMLAAFVFSRFVVPVYLDRGLIVSAPFFYILLGAGLDAMGRKLRAVLLTAVILLTASGIYGFYRDRMPAPLSHHTGVHLKKPFKPAVEFIKSTAGEDDIVAFTNDSLKLPFIWYSEGKNHVFFDKRRRNKPGRLGNFRFIFAPGCLTPSYRELKKESEFNIPLDKACKMRFKRLFVLSCDWPRDKTTDRNSSFVRKELDGCLDLKLKKEFHGLWIYCYEKK